MHYDRISEGENHDDSLGWQPCSEVVSQRYTRSLNNCWSHLRAALMCDKNWHKTKTQSHEINAKFQLIYKQY